MGHAVERRSLTPAAWGGLVFAMTFPTVIALLYFVVLTGTGYEKTVYRYGKIIQFTFPLVFVLVADRALPRPQRPRFDGLAVGLGFGVVVAAAMFGLYYGWLVESSAMVETPAMVRAKLHEAFEISTPAAYFGLTAFIVVAHSLMEEYYWRWFVFRRLRDGLSFGPAALLSSLAFMAHHVVIMCVYFPGYFWTAAVPLSLGIAAGGMVWAWLYERTDSIWSPWLSHAIVDAAIFVIGWNLVQRGGGL
jgi:membrane protease YdiL (CAAX protease family)